ncbi:MAG: hypothetical protein K0B02_02590 [DPANN group archaeon]|nr:hypothetical protein [DPANN group archaeon]
MKEQTKSNEIFNSIHSSPYKTEQGLKLSNSQITKAKSKIKDLFITVII